MLTLSELTSSAEEMKVSPRASRHGCGMWSTCRVVSDRTVSSIPRSGVATLDNWAMWLRRTDDDTGPDPVEVTDTSGIGRHTEALIEAAGLRNMRIF